MVFHSNLLRARYYILLWVSQTQTLNTVITKPNCVFLLIVSGFPNKDALFRLLFFSFVFFCLLRKSLNMSKHMFKFLFRFLLIASKKFKHVCMAKLSLVMIFDLCDQRRTYATDSIKKRVQIVKIEQKMRFERF